MRSVDSEPLFTGQFAYKALHNKDTADPGALDADADERISGEELQQGLRLGQPTLRMHS